VKENGVHGVITGSDVLRNTLTILRAWGLRCYFRCLRAALSRRSSTFLEVMSADWRGRHHAWSE
jgi:hypothetical protein